ncbi:LOW QUALITY PROTEIN: reverse transcriptase [Phytophthora megakarya]|uniref:Reverse transcriptase n=1 Tax=Phytophthora megakarya TaxID=4795 RepID=A0A225VQZ0_9STRA|nr:LOW QUALITY PROTEIN: reverse transcriptase [Phytophthora megakarya]
MHPPPSPRRANPRLPLHKRKFSRDIYDTRNRHGDPEPSWSRVEKISSILDIGDLTVTTRLQARSKPKRVRFADETSVTGGEDVTQREEANGVPTEDSGFLETESRLTAPNGNTPALPNAEDVDPLTVQRERRRRIATAQDEELRWANLKTVLCGEESNLTYRAERNAWKMSDHFVLSEDNVLCYVGTRPLRCDQQQEDTMLRLVVPSTKVQEVLQNCHDSLEGGHQGIARTFYRVRLDYYWIGLYTDVARHVRSCPDCSSSKSRPKIRGFSPGNILAERPFQVVSTDFVIPLPKSRRGNTALLLFQCAFTGYVIDKPMTDTTALRVAQAFEECVREIRRTLSHQT